MGVQWDSRGFQGRSRDVPDAFMGVPLRFRGVLKAFQECSR